ncbi:MAG: hypothetical protein HQ581_18135 [Planctomycetes bacterium]|nr:hypothetical protein [Planctomycetota bacterium]
MRIRHVLAVSGCFLATSLSAMGDEPMIPVDSFRHYIERFNADDEELYSNAFPNDRAWEFLAANVLNDHPQEAVTKKDYLLALSIYTKSHRRTLGRLTGRLPGE